MEPIACAAPCSAQIDNAASLAVVEKAGAKALTLDLPPLAFQAPEGRWGPGLTPMSACGDLMMSPSSPFTPFSPGFSFAGVTSALSPVMSSTTPAPNGFSLGPFTNPNGATNSAVYTMPPVAMSPCTPGTEIRRNAANFGIPLTLEQVGVPIPIRTTSGMVFAPSPTTATSSIMTTGVAPAAAGPAVGAVAQVPAAPAVMPMAVTHVPVVQGVMPTAGNRPFVTPFSAGLRVTRTGGVGGA